MQAQDFLNRLAEYKGRVSALREALDAAPKFTTTLPTPADGATTVETYKGLAEAFAQVMNERSEYSRRLSEMFREATLEFELIRKQVTVKQISDARLKGARRKP